MQGGQSSGGFNEFRIKNFVGNYPSCARKLYKKFVVSGNIKIRYVQKLFNIRDRLEVFFAVVYAGQNYVFKRDLFGMMSNRAVIFQIVDDLSEIVNAFDFAPRFGSAAVD